MMKLLNRVQPLLLLCCLWSGLKASPGPGVNSKGQPVYKDTAYRQPYSIKFLLSQNNGALLKKVYSDRNGVIQVLSSQDLLTVTGGQFLYPGQLVKDVSYQPMLNKKISNIGIYQNQFVYLDDKAVLSNAWAGNLYSRHTMPAASLFSGGKDFDFLLSDGASLQYTKDSKVLWQGNANDKLIDIVFDKKRNQFWLLGQHTVSVFSPVNNSIAAKYKGDSLTCFTLANNNAKLIVGTHNGYITLDASNGSAIGHMQRRLPATNLTVVKEINGKLWFGSTSGAFMLQEDGKYKYYASKRWLPSDIVTDISAGNNGTVLLLTSEGLGEIHFTSMTLHDKAMYYEKQVRSRHIRLGFNSTISRMKNGDVSTGSLEDSDNDGLWTSMYLGAEVFRYAATKSPEALENCRESLDAMERLYTVTSLKGFPARSYERRGYAIADTQVWKRAENPEWDWKSTTSSDEAIGHIFVFGAVAELIDDTVMKNKAIRLMDALMQHIVDHDWYMIDWNGKPTRWGRWNPEYVNARPKIVGDRKITSSNIIAMLQTAWHFTGKAIYKDKAFELMNKHGFLENLMRPMKEIGPAPADADELSKELSDGWNHSDDEMYFVGYWGLYRYAFNDTLKAKYKEAILDHWQIERPEKEGAWNIFTALTDVHDFDLNEAVWYLQKYPMDMINWKVRNSHRKDIDTIPANFRNQTTKEVLPPDELRISRHNANRFDLDGGDQHGGEELSAGDIWLLPYWMGRYLNVISAPVENKAAEKPVTAAQESHKDVPFTQRYSIKYYVNDNAAKLTQVAQDHNGNIQVLSSSGLLKPRGGELLKSGTLVKDVAYLSIVKKKIAAITTYKNEFVYTDDNAVFSNAWAGTLYTPHSLAAASIVAAGNDGCFLVAGDKRLSLLQNDKVLWSGEVADNVKAIQFSNDENLFWVLSAKGIVSFSPVKKQLVNVYSGDGLTCFKVLQGKLLVGTHNGFMQLDAPLYKASVLNNKLPCADISVIEQIDSSIWFGSSKGAFMLKKDGTYDYYASERWLPSDAVTSIAEGDNNSVLVLTTKGLAKICAHMMTLDEKAAYYEDIVRKRHIRYGFYCDYTNVRKGDTAAVIMGPHDSDNLWTSMYLTSQLFRYLVTHNEEAKQNCSESIAAMERLFTLSGIEGLFGRCIERTGTIAFHDEIREEDKYYWYPGYDHMPSSWRHSNNSEWDWRGSASSDQAVGQYFALTMVAQYADDAGMKKRAINLIDKLTNYIVSNNLTLVDFNGKPTLWGRWNPEHVNRFPDMVGDKKLYSSNIISFLQTAWHFTGKKEYKAKAEELLYKHHYLDNLARPISDIGPAPATADKWSQILSGGWNSSDDEMYFLAYWGLYPYALNDTLKNKYKEAIQDHWNIIRPEKEALWNLCYGAITGAKEFDLKEAIWELQRMPLDLATWRMNNSSRQDLVFEENTKMSWSVKEVLPPDERPENKHNRNLFKLDENGNGQSELGGGDVYLLPYWMGRYFGKISAPVNE